MLTIVVKKRCGELLHLFGQVVEVLVDRFPDIANLPQPSGQLKGIAQGVGVGQPEVGETGEKWDIFAMPGKIPCNFVYILSSQVMITVQ